jgi:hypothetical protein
MHKRAAARGACVYLSSRLNGNVNVTASRLHNLTPRESLVQQTYDVVARDCSQRLRQARTVPTRIKPRTAPKLPAHVTALEDAFPVPSLCTVSEVTFPPSPPLHMGRWPASFARHCTATISESAIPTLH